MHYNHSLIDLFLISSHFEITASWKLWRHINVTAVDITVASERVILVFKK